MRAPAFWQRPGSVAERIFRPFGVLYGAVAAHRLSQPGERIGIPVICIGNPTLGGAGKTPTAIATARLLMGGGEQPFFLTRGYGGRLPGPVRVDSARHGAEDVGDEALLLATVAPTVVARDRLAGGRAARDSGASVVVMDDGFQNPSLNKDASVLVVDSARRLGNGAVFPAGPLRAPLAAQLGRAQALVVVRRGSARTKAELDAVQALAPGLPTFGGWLEPDPAAVRRLGGQRVLAFAGIGDPEKFFATLHAIGAELGERFGFADHHRYTAADAGMLLAKAARSGSMLVTTEKDMARMGGDTALDELAKTAITLPVRLTLDDEAEFCNLAVAALRVSRSARDSAAT